MNTKIAGGYAFILVFFTATYFVIMNRYDGDLMSFWAGYLVAVVAGLVGRWMDGVSADNRKRRTS